MTGPAAVVILLAAAAGTLSWIAAQLLRDNDDQDDNLRFSQPGAPGVDPRGRVGPLWPSAPGWLLQRPVEASPLMAPWPPRICAGRVVVVRPFAPPSDSASRPAGRHQAGYGWPAQEGIA